MDLTLARHGGVVDRTLVRHGGVVDRSSCHFEALVIFFTPQSLSLLNCINEYLAIDSGGYVNE